MALFPQLQKTAGGFFDRINQAAANPSFALGIGFLNGNPQGGFQQAAMIRQQQAEQQQQQQAMQAAQQQAMQKIQQQALENDYKERDLKQRAMTDAQKTAAFITDDPAEQKSLVKRMYEAKIAGETKPLVSLNQTQEREFSKGVGKLQAEQYGKVTGEGAEANNQLVAVAQLEEILNSGIATGPIANAALPVKQLASSLGLDVDNERIAKQETFRTITNQMALRLRNPESGLGLTGSTSERDLQFLKDSVPGLDKTEAGNRLIIDFYKRAQNRKIEAAGLAEKYVEQTGSLTGFSSYAKAWADQNPLFTDEDRARAKAAKDAPAAAGAELFPGFSALSPAEQERARKLMNGE